MTTRRTLLGSALAAGAGVLSARATADASPSRFRPLEGAAHEQIAKVLDDWHAAAAAADESRYFGHMTADAVFLGTDATERWTKAEFQAYAHPHFAKGRAWSFTSVRRTVAFAADGRVAWFEEDLATPNLGPARGSGVLVLEDRMWRIAQYNLSVPIPNGIFDDVKKLIAAHLAKPKA